MVDRFYPDRAHTLRTSTVQELKATTVIGMAIENASAKVRNKGVGDEEEDYALPIYAARFPVHMVVARSSRARACRPAWRGPRAWLASRRAGGSMKS